MAPLVVFIALNLLALDRAAVEVSAQDDVRNEIACIGTPLLLDCSDVPDHVILATVTLAVKEAGKSCDVGNISCVTNYREIFLPPQEVIDQVYGCVLKNVTCSLQSTSPITHRGCLPGVKTMDRWEATYECVPKSDVYAVSWGNHHVPTGQVVTVHSPKYPDYSYEIDNTTDFSLDSWSQIDISMFEWKLPATAVLMLWSLDQSGGVLQSFRFNDTNVPQTLTMEGFGIRVHFVKSPGSYAYFAFTFNSTALSLPDTTEIPVTTITSGAGVSMTTWGYGVPVSIAALLAMTIPAIMARKLT